MTDELGTVKVMLSGKVVKEIIANWAIGAFLPPMQFDLVEIKQKTDYISLPNDFELTFVEVKSFDDTSF